MSIKHQYSFNCWKARPFRAFWNQLRCLRGKVTHATVSTAQTFRNISVVVTSCFLSHVVNISIVISDQRILGLQRPFLIWWPVSDCQHSKLHLYLSLFLSLSRLLRRTACERRARQKLFHSLTFQIEISFVIQWICEKKGLVGWEEPAVGHNTAWHCSGRTCLSLKGRWYLFASWDYLDHYSSTIVRDSRLWSKHELYKSFKLKRNVHPDKQIN